MFRCARSVSQDRRFEAFLAGPVECGKARLDAHLRLARTQPIS